MLTKNIWKRGISLLGAAAMTASMLTGISFAEGEAYTQPTLNPHSKSVLEVDGYQFIDLTTTASWMFMRIGGRMPRRARLTW